MLTIPAAPRFATPRNPGYCTLGGYLNSISDDLGFVPHEWQSLVNEVSTQLSPRESVLPGQSTLKLHAQHVGCMVGRQSGKTAWAVTRVVAQAMLPYQPEIAHQLGLERIVPQRIMYTAQRRVSAVERWKEHCEIIVRSPIGRYVEHIAGQTGHEKLTFTNGSTYQPVTPNKNSPRGTSNDLIIVDEALAHPMWLLSALRPTMAQRHSANGCIGAQFVVISNAGNDDSELLNHLQELGQKAIADSDDSRVWFEWSMAPGSDPFDENTWSSTMPTLNQPNGISLEFLREEASSMRLNDFMREYLCHRVNDSDDRVINWDHWQSLYRIDVVNSGSPVVAVDVSWDRSRASIVAASGVDEYIPVEVIDAREGVEWVTDRLIGIAERNGAPVVIDAGGPAASLIMVLENRGIEVIAFTARDVANSAASFYDNVQSKRIAHLNDYRLNDAIKGATKRALGERWGFNRKGNVDISPLVAASFAVWVVDSGMVDKPAIYPG